MDREEYAEHVLRLVERIPAGRVTTYGAIAAGLGVGLGVGGPRQVGAVLAQHGGGVPWWRVVRADGTLPASHGEDARAHYRAEATPLTPTGRPDLRRAFWEPA